MKESERPDSPGLSVQNLKGYDKQKGGGAI